MICDTVLQYSTVLHCTAVCPVSDFAWHHISKILVWLSVTRYTVHYCTVRKASDVPPSALRGNKPLLELKLTLPTRRKQERWRRRENITRPWSLCVLRFGTVKRAGISLPRSSPRRMDPQDDSNPKSLFVRPVMYRDVSHLPQDMLTRPSVQEATSQA